MCSSTVVVIVVVVISVVEVGVEVIVVAVVIVAAKERYVSVCLSIVRKKLCMSTPGFKNRQVTNRKLNQNDVSQFKNVLLILMSYNLETKQVK